jgi:glycosyltransferase involved in cell wall biosynthesis
MPSTAHPLVSVIIPVYNVEKYLPRCLDSVIAQTEKNLEIICVDDGSTDSSGAILAEYAAKDPRMRVVEKENGGLSSARNAGHGSCRRAMR